jgi:lysine 6-dehydrogenase
VTSAFAVLGAGRQGTAAAFDLAVRGSAASVTLGDIDEGAARAAAERVNRLSGTDIARGASVDVSDEAAVAAFLETVDAAISAVPYWLNLGVTHAALRARTSVCDLGGSMAVVHAQLELDADARERGICLVPDCGEAPGMGNNVMARAIDLLEEAGADPQELILYDGGIPLEPEPPWNYEVTFNIEGLTNEYDGATTFVIDGAPTDVACLDPAEYETLDFGEPFGMLEAFPAATSSTTPWTLGRRLRTLRSKVLRYPGHAAQWLAFRDAGLFGQDPIEVDGATVVPRRLFHALMEPRIRARAGARDVVIARAIATDGDGRRATVDVRVYPDEALGFTAMERATGWHAAIVCHRMASGRVAPGATPVELAVPARDMMEELRRRGFQVDERVYG